MPKYRLTVAMHPMTTDTWQAYIWALAHYCEGECFPWMRLTPTQIVRLANAGRLTLLSLIEITPQEIVAIAGCDAATADFIAKGVADDAAYWSGPEYVREAEEVAPQFGKPSPVSYEDLRRAHPEYRKTAPVALLPVPGQPFPWPQGKAWDEHMSALIVGQFEDGGHEIRGLLYARDADVPGRDKYLRDPHVVAKYEARRGELKRDIANLAAEAQTYELAQWLVGELRSELRDVEHYLDRWLAQHP